MKVHAAVASLFILTLAAKADWVVEAKIEAPQMNSATTTKIKGDKIRSDVASGPMGAMSSIIDTASGDAIQLIHAQKMAVKTSGEQMKEMINAFKPSAGPDPAKPQSTGQKEKVGDHECEIWTWSGGNMASKFWVATNHPQAAALKAVEKTMRSGALAAQGGADTSVLPGPVLKTEMSVGTAKTTMTILSIKEQAVDAKEFEVPAGYQTMGIPGAK